MKMKKVFFYTQIVLIIVMTIGIVISILFGDKYDFVCLVPALLSFTLFWVYGFFKQRIDNKFFDFDLREIKLRYRIILLIVIFTFLGFSTVGFFLSSFYGGNEELIDGTYQIISHNNFVRYITKEEYNVLHFFSRYSWIFTIYVIALLHMLSLKYKDENSALK